MHLHHGDARRLGLVVDSLHALQHRLALLAVHLGVCRRRGKQWYSDIVATTYRDKSHVMAVSTFNYRAWH